MQKKKKTIYQRPKKMKKKLDPVVKAAFIAGLFEIIALLLDKLL